MNLLLTLSKAFDMLKFNVSFKPLDVDNLHNQESPCVLAYNLFHCRGFDCQCRQLPIPSRTLSELNTSWLLSLDSV
jgi:hypothetical protein